MVKTNKDIPNPKQIQYSIDSILIDGKIEIKTSKADPIIAINGLKNIINKSIIIITPFMIFIFTF